MKRKKHVLFRCLLLIVVAVGLLFADSALRVVTTEYELTYPVLPVEFDGFRVVQLSDLHGAEFGQGNARLLKKVAQAEPDVIVLTGDLADKNTDMAVVDGLLGGLTQIAPVYYVSGNHEWSEHLLDALRVLFDQHGVTYLRNEYVCLTRGGPEIVLAGVEDPNGWADQPKPDAVIRELREAYPEAFTLLLGHRNDFVEKYPDLPVQLILCGHAHGGIVRLPGIGGLLGTGGTFFPDYTEGAYRIGAYRMIVSRGLGSSVPVPRFLNNPEIVAITLRAN